MADTAAHWAVGHNVSGYVPESDVSHVSSWDDAKTILAGDMAREQDFCDYAPSDDPRADALHASVTEAIGELERATAGAEFLAYTDDGGEHTIPTAWWINVCAETECDVDGDPE